MAKRPDISAADFIPADLPSARGKRLEVLREAAQGCRGCDLCENATQAVFGEGSISAKVMFLGEQPGDQEDRQGKPFVGPSGTMLDDVLEEVGIDRKKVYVTNTVKHFKFTQRGKRRIHQKPVAREINACRPWLEQELQTVQPEVLVCLGATAAQAVLGRDFRVTRQHGEVLETDYAPWTMGTFHPSALLRVPQEEARQERIKVFTEDLAKVADHLREVS